MTTIFVIGILLFLVYVIVSIAKFGVPSSLSETYYKWGGKPQGYVFTAAMWLTVFCIAPLWFSVSKDWATFSVFFAAGGLLLVGAAPIFKEQDKGWHSVFAIICAVFATLWQFLHCQFWEVPLFAIVFFAIAYRTDTLKLCKTFWLELTAFCSTFLSILICTISQS